MKSWSWALLLFLALFLFGCTIEQQGDATIRLTVLGQENQPIYQATVEIKDTSGKIVYSAQTNENGLIKTKIEPGNYTIKIEKEGFETIEQNQTIQENEIKIITINLNEDDLLGATQNPGTEPEAIEPTNEAYLPLNKNEKTNQQIAATGPTRITINCTITNPTTTNPVTKKNNDSQTITFSIKNRNQKPIKANYRIQIFDPTISYGFYNGNWPNGKITIPAGTTLTINADANWNNQPDGNYHVGAFLFDEQGKYLNVNCEQKNSLIIKNPYQCGNNYCDESENDQTCPQDCLANFCPANRTATINSRPLNRERIELLPMADSSKAYQLTLEMNQLMQENKTTQAQNSANERKNEMLKLAEENPTEFMNIAQLTKNNRKTLNQITPGIVEEEKTITGNLEIIEKPHLENNLQETDQQKSGFDYFVNSNNKKYKVTFADNTTPPAVSSSIVKVSGVNLDNYLVTSSAQTKGFQVIKSNNEPIIGTWKVAIVFTRPTGGTEGPDDHDIEGIMQKVRNYFYEVSYHRLSNVTWQVFGPYETQGEQQPEFYNIEEISNGEIELSEFDSIILIDERNRCDGCATAGKTYVQNPNGEPCDESTCDKLGKVWFHSEYFAIANAVTHELGHNFGLRHANTIHCGGIGVIYPEGSNCRTKEYGDFFDAMGYNIYLEGNPGSFNAPHKETIGWLNENEITTANTNDTYEIYPITSNLSPKAIKIPTKFDDAGQPTQYDYLEYRQPQGIDEDIFTTRQGSPIKSGPQLRKTGYISGSGGGGDTHQITTSERSDTSSDYPWNAPIEVGEIFTDPNGITINTISADEVKTRLTIQVPVNNCVRHPLSLIVSPTIVSDVLVDEAVYFDFSLKNNDELSCSSRQIGSNYLGYSTNPYIGDTSYPTKIDAGQSINGSVMVWTNYHTGHQTVIIEVEDVERQEKVQQTITIERVENRTDEPIENASAKEFIYNEQGNGRHVLDDQGKIHNYGITKKVYANSIDFSGNDFPKAVSIDSSKRNDDTLVIVDSTGILYNVGEFRKEVLGSKKFDMGCMKTIGVSLSTEASQEKITVSDDEGKLNEKTIGMYFPSSRCLDDGIENAIDFIMYNQPDNRYSDEVFLNRNGSLKGCDDFALPNNYLTFNAPPTNLIGDRFMAAMTIDPEKGIYAVDSYGKVYTTGTAQNLGDHDYGRNIVRDIQLKPDKSGYGILLEDGQVIEYPVSTK